MVALFVLLTFVLFIAVDMLVLRVQRKKHPAFAETMADIAVFTKEAFMAPIDLFISKAHTWAQKNEYGLVKIGIDEFVLKAMGNISLVKIAQPETVVKKGDVLFEGTTGMKTLQFRSPINGTVKFNNPDVLNKRITDPYGDDWGVLVAAEDFNENKKELYTGSELKGFMKNEFSRLKDFLHQHTLRPELAGATMLDGGNVVEGVVSSITVKGLEDFEKEFLTF
jgi:glycine cleavage system H protein